MADFLAQAWPFAAAVLVILGIVALVFLVLILFRVFKTMESVQNMAASAEKEVTPALAKVNPMVDKAELLVDQVNLEMLRVDAILEDVEQVSNIAGKTASTVDTVTSAPAEVVTSFIDRIRGNVGSKHSDKLKQSRVVYPIGTGEQSPEGTAAEARDVEANVETIEGAAQTAAQAASDPEPQAEQPVGKHSVASVPAQAAPAVPVAQEATSEHPAE